VSAAAGSLVRRRHARRGAAPAAAGAIAAGAAVGLAVGAEPRAGVALAFATLAIAVALADLPVAIALWAVLVQMSNLPPFGVAANAAAFLAIGAWVARAPAHRAEIRAALHLHRRLLTIVAALLVWLALSLAWVHDTAIALEALGAWSLVAVMLVVMVTALRTARDVCVVLAGVLAGTLLSITVGLAAASAGSSVAIVEGRLAGGIGDPNYLAAFILPAVVVVVPLARAVGPAARWLVAPTLALLIVGFVGTESRGGLIAAAAAFAAAIVFPPGRRAVSVAGAVAILCAALAVVVVQPGVVERVTEARADRGNGREDLWIVAARMSADHPWTGVGVGNFQVRSADYVRQPGALSYVGAVIERPRAVHNAYLHVLAESGVVGLGLFALFVLTTMRALLVAAQRFAGLGEHVLARLSRALLVGNIGLLTAAVFLSIGADRTVWLLLALGPVLLGIASTAQVGRNASPSRTAYR
jgi:O-antigen ligase